MRYAAQLEGRPAAELLAQLPPLPPGAAEMPFGGLESGAMDLLLSLVFEWPLMMRRLAPPGQDFLLQLPGGLGELPPSLVHSGSAACDAEWHVAVAMQAKERGNTSFVGGITVGALREYNTGINHLCALTARHLARINQTWVLPVQEGQSFVQDPTAAVEMVRHALGPLIHIELFPYQGQHYVRAIREDAAVLLYGSPPLPAAIRLPGCSDLPSLIGSFWNQLTAKFMEPYGGVEGLLVDPEGWKHHVAQLAVDPPFYPITGATGSRVE
jgi:hypothetical protein